jgi:hypothetical protein
MEAVESLIGDGVRPGKVARAARGSGGSNESGGVSCWALGAGCWVLVQLCTRFASNTQPPATGTRGTGELKESLTEHDRPLKKRGEVEQGETSARVLECSSARQCDKARPNERANSLWLFSGGAGGGGQS